MADYPARSSKITTRFKSPRAYPFVVLDPAQVSRLTREFGPESPAFLAFREKVLARFSAGDPRARDLARAFHAWQACLATTSPSDELTRARYVKHAYLVHLARQCVERVWSKGENGWLALDPPLFAWTAGGGCGCNLPDSPRLDEWLAAGRDVLTPLYQAFFSPDARHALGEFYTPPPLAREMVAALLSTVEDPGAPRAGKATEPPRLPLAVDPTCGSGVFLRALYSALARAGARDQETQKARDLARVPARVVGFDVNPAAVLVARANLLLLARHLGIPPAFPRVFLFNPLLPSEYARPAPAPALAHRVDVVVGNPPWLVLNRVPSRAYKRLLKTLGERFGILLGGNTATSTELTTVFVHHAFEHLLRPGGRLGFVGPAALLTGQQHARFRAFAGMTDVAFWTFDTDIFRVHSCCFFATADPARQADPRAATQTLLLQPPHAQTRHAQSRHVQTRRSQLRQPPTRPHPTNPRHLDVVPLVTMWRVTGNTWTLERVKSERFRPAYVKHDARGPLVGRLNPESEVLDVTWLHSPYREDFYQGASLVPRNLVLVDVYPAERPDHVTLQPAARMQRKKGSRWDFFPFETATVERRFVYPVAKSSNLVPFALLRLEQAFLPLVPRPPGYAFVDSGAVSPSTRRHLARLRALYQEHRKPSATVTTLRARLNYQKYLTTPLQRAPLRVVYNGIGSRVKACLLRDARVVVDTSLYQHAPATGDEAYFLLGLLNAPVITRVAQHAGSAGAHGSLRNIHQRPLEVWFPRYRGTPEELQVAAVAREMEARVQEFARAWRAAEFTRVRGKWWCPVCRKYLPAGDVPDHPGQCPRAGKYPSPRWPPLVELTAPARVAYRVRTVQNRVLADDRFQELHATLDALVRDHLHSPKTCTRRPPAGK